MNERLLPHLSDIQRELVMDAALAMKKYCIRKDGYKDNQAFNDEFIMDLLQARIEQKNAT